MGAITRAEAFAQLRECVDRWERDPHVLYWPGSSVPICEAITRKGTRCTMPVFAQSMPRGAWWLVDFRDAPPLVHITDEDLELLRDGLCSLHLRAGVRQRIERAP